MRPITTLLLCIFIGVFVGGCTTKFKVVSQPEKAVVYVVDSETNEKKKLGETPFEKKEGEVRDILGELKSNTNYLILIEKEGYSSMNIWLPVTSSGTLATELKVKLIADKTKQKNFETVSSILDQIFLAQSFARSNQMSRALSEIEKILKVHPKLARALAMKGAIFYAKREFKKSLKWYERSLAANPKSEQIVKMLGKARKAIGRSKTRLPAGRKK